MAKSKAEALFGSKRVPLETNGVPLLYPRFQSVEALKQSATSAKTKAANTSVATALADAARKLLEGRKRKAGDAEVTDADAGAAAGAAGDDAAAAGPSGGDTTSVKALCKMEVKRAKRAARDKVPNLHLLPKPAAEEGGNGAAGAAADGAAASGAGKVEQVAAPVAEGTAAVAVAEAAAAVRKSSGAGNASEAQKIREALGYAEPSDAGGADDAAEEEEAMAAGGVAAEAEEAEAEGDRDGDGDGEGGEGDGDGLPLLTKKQRKKERQRAKAEAAAGGATGAAGAAAPGDGGASSSGAAAAAVTVAAVAQGASVPRGKKGGFSFGFQLVQEEVEAATEAKIKSIMMVDSADKEGFVPRRVFVCGMPHEWDEGTLTEYWAFCGEIASMDLLRFPDTGNFNGTMFITFTTDDAYQTALTANGEEIEGRSLRVEKCKAAAGKRAAAGAAAARTGAGGGAVGGGSERVDGYNVAYVGNIAYDVTREELIALFRPHKSTQVRLHTDKDSGKPKGFAHVHFADAETLEAAMALDGTEMAGRAIKMSFAQPKRS
ncbi:hypothetical protein FOA52_015930 [Chlamydomonas sp. UWO 241]|nr:hypothetical protein FOA52_015930 [Chlamydomonas sp. UWO 241]